MLHSYGMVINENGEQRDVFPPWRMFGIAMVDGSKTKLAYWESRFELFEWACIECGFNPETSGWVDGITGEVQGYWELFDEAYDEEIA